MFAFVVMYTIVHLIMNIGNVHGNHVVVVHILAHYQLNQFEYNKDNIKIQKHLCSI